MQNHILYKHVSMVYLLESRPKIIQGNHDYKERLPLKVMSKLVVKKTQFRHVIHHLHNILPIIPIDRVGWPRECTCYREIPDFRAPRIGGKAWSGERFC